MAEPATIINWQPGIQLPGGHAAFGVFDGVHLGHQHLINATIKAAKMGGASIILTFDCDPLGVVAPHLPLKKLMTDEHRILALAQSGMEYVVVFPFNERTSKLSSTDFLAALGLLDNTWQLASLHVGENLHFGAQGGADADDLAQLLPNTEAVAHKLLKVDGAVVSSSRIRSLIAAGSIAESNKLLGHPRALEGVVVHGDGRGAAIGYPTANIVFDANLVMPADAVYAGMVEVGDTQYAAAISVGVPSTFAVQEPTFEAYILDFDSDIYGAHTTVKLIAKLRPMQKFANAAALTTQLQSDIARTRSLLSV